MKYLAIMITFLLAVPTMPQADQKETITITVTIEGIRNSSGSLGVALFNEDSEFPDDGGFMTEEVSLRSSGSVEVTFKDVPVGDYAVGVMHDENDNGDIDFNEYGMPLEGFGFSNDAMGNQGPPSFDEAAFTADEDTDVSVTLMYMGGY